MNPLLFLLTCFAGWMNRQQQFIIEYLQEEIRVPYCPKNHRHVMRLAGNSTGAYRPGAFDSEPHLQAETPRIQAG